MLFGCQEDESHKSNALKSATNLLKTKLTAFGKC